MDLFQQVIWAFDICPIGNQIWYAAGGLNGIFCVDIETGKTSFATQFDAYSNREFLLYSYIVERENHLYFCPYLADSVCEYNIADGSKKYYLLEGVKNAHVIHAVLNHKNLYMFCEKGNIIILNLKNKDITVVNNKDVYQRYLSGGFLGKDIICKADHIYFPDGKNIVELNELLQIKNIYDFSNYSKKEITTVTCVEDKMWMTCNGSQIIYWDQKTNDIFTHAIPIEGLPIKSIVNDNKLYIFYRYLNRVLIFDMKKFDSLVVDIKEGYSVDHDHIQLYWTFKKSNTEGIYIYTYMNNNIIYIKPNGEVTYTRLYLDDETRFFTDYLSAFYNGDIIYEGNWVYASLETFIEYGCRITKGINTSNEVGKMIYKTLNIRR